METLLTASHPAQIIFVHLPKTGGMSLHAAMEAAFGAARVLRAGDDATLARFRAMDRAAMAGFAFVSGHFTLAEALDRAAPGARFVTLLRDPVERLVSAFNYMASWTGHPNHAEFRHLGFADWLASAGDALAGEACRQLAGVPTAAEAVPILEGCYAAVGTTARQGDLAALACRWVGLAPPAPRRENVTPGQGRITLDSATCARLLEVTHEDRLLFEHVAARHGGLLVAPGLG